MLLLFLFIFIFNKQVLLFVLLFFDTKELIMVTMQPQFRSVSESSWRELLLKVPQFIQVNSIRPNGGEIILDCTSFELQMGIVLLLLVECY